MKITKHHKIWLASLLLLALTTQGMWWLFPKAWVETFFIVLGAFFFGVLWGMATAWIERR